MRYKVTFVRFLNLLTILALLLTYQLVHQFRAQAEEISKLKYELALSKQKSKSDTVTSDPLYNDGVYKGAAEGFGGIIEVEVVVKNGHLDDVKIISAKKEDIPYMEMAKEILSEMKKNHSSNVDTISGATFSSKGIKNAVKAALSKAVKSN